MDERHSQWLHISSQTEIWVLCWNVNLHHGGFHDAPGLRWSQVHIKERKSKHVSHHQGCCETVVIHNWDMIKVFLIRTLKHEEESRYSSKIPSERDLREVIPVEPVHPTCYTNYLSSVMGWLRRVYIRHSDLVCMLWCSLSLHRYWTEISLYSFCSNQMLWEPCLGSFLHRHLSHRLKRRLSSLFGQKTSSDELESSSLSLSCPPDTRRLLFPLSWSN